MTKISKVSTAIVGIFMLMPGVVKFFNPFKTFFAEQIELSNLPFPHISYVIGQTSEIVTGMVLLLTLFFHSRIHEGISTKFYLWANMFVVSILLVALYVHFHPEVPAEILPFGKKTPILTVVLLLLVGINFYEYKRFSMQKSK